jgi:hypothetical protein
MASSGLRNEASSTKRPAKCHSGEQELLLFVPRDRAMCLRRRLLSDSRFATVHISPLYRVGTGWGVKLCAECFSLAARRRSERPPRPARSA